MFLFIYYYNYKNGINPSFNRIFSIFAGRVPPKNMGLTNINEIEFLIKITHRLNGWLHFNNDKVLPIIFSIFVPGVYYIYLTTLEAIIYAIPNTIIILFNARYFWNFIGYQFMMFYIICLYLKIKINALNESLLEMKKRKRFIRIRETLQSFDWLYSEINEYNNTFWSKFLAVIWLFFGLIITLIIYIILFIPIALVIKSILIDCCIIVVLIFLFIIFTTSSVTYSANKSYKILNSLFISYSKLNKHILYFRLFNKFKVNIFITNMSINNILSFLLFRYLHLLREWPRGMLDFLFA